MSVHKGASILTTSAYAFSIASQLPVQQWYDIIGEATIADAILDRLVHDAHRIELQGESLRKRKKVETTEVLEMEG